jgi:hypothetical protein
VRTTRTILPLMVVLGLVTAVGWAQNASKTAIVKSPHDLTNDTWNAGTGDAAVTTNLCFFCHITHKTVTSSSGIIGGTVGSTNPAPGYLLWNHQISATTSYGVYSSDSFQNLLTQTGSAGPTDLGAGNTLSTLTVSNLCLSCHDGTVAIGSFYEGGMGLPANGSQWNNGHGDSTNMYSGMEISDLSKSHPVHFPYTATLASAGTLKIPASVNSVDGNGAVPLYGGGGNLECSTCHDPHNGATAVKGTTFPFARSYLYNYTGTGGFCTYCHI